MIIMPIDIPEGCGLCLCNYDGWCSLQCIIGNRSDSLEDLYRYSKTQRDPNCPLREQEEKQ